MTGLWILLGLVVVLGGWVASTYNKAVALRNYVRESFSTMDVYLKKRWDLIPNLVESVKAYMEHESGVLEKVVALRAKPYEQMNADEKISANTALGALMPKIFALSENYPNLKANENHVKLMSELSAVEEDIATSRKYYNGTARELNNFLEQFPTNIVGSLFKFEKAKYYEIDQAERENVKVSFK